MHKNDPPSVALPLWVPSFFLSRRTKAKQATPHSAVRQRAALIAAPCADQPGIPLCLRGHFEGERERQLEIEG